MMSLLGLSRDRVFNNNGGSLEQRECGFGVSRRAGQHHVRGLLGLARRAFWAPFPVRGQLGGVVGAGRKDVPPQQVGRGHGAVEPSPLAGARLCRLEQPTRGLVLVEGRRRRRPHVAARAHAGHQRSGLVVLRGRLVGQQLGGHLHLHLGRQGRPQTRRGAVRRGRRIAGEMEPRERQRAGVQSRRRRAHLGQTESRHGLRVPGGAPVQDPRPGLAPGARVHAGHQQPGQLGPFLGLPPAQEVPGRPLLPGPRLEGQIHALLQRPGDGDGSSAAAREQSPSLVHAGPQQSGPRLCGTRRRGPGVPVAASQTSPPRLPVGHLVPRPDLEDLEAGPAAAEAVRGRLDGRVDGRRPSQRRGGQVAGVRRPARQDSPGAASGRADAAASPVGAAPVTRRRLRVWLRRSSRNSLWSICKFGTSTWRKKKVPFPGGQMDAVKCSCVVSAHFGSHRVRLLIKFPGQYPNNCAPAFQFVSPTTISAAMKTKIHKILTDVSLQKVKRNQNCLEPCVRKLVSCLESHAEDAASSGPFVLSDPVAPTLPAFPRVTNTYGSYQDANIPFPRTSGARFCGTGCLVYFTRPVGMHRAVPAAEPTPRSLSALSAYHSGVLTPMKIRSESQNALRLYGGSPTRADKDAVSISSFYYKERKSRRFKTKRDGADGGVRSLKLAGKVIVQEISCLLPVHKVLGENYTLNTRDTEDTCQKNAAAALAAGRRDVAKVWALASAATARDLRPDPDPDADAPWASHPFGRHLLETLVDHYSHMSDVQTLAMMCSVFGGSAAEPAPPPPPPSRRAALPPYTRYSGPSETTAPGSRDPPEPRGESPEGARQGNRGAYGEPRERERHELNKRLLDPANAPQFDDFKKCYAEILYRWDLRDKRADVLKFASCSPESHRGVELRVLCCHCGSPGRGAQCAACKRHSFRCAVCHVAVRGSSHFCLSCGHGGHTGHMMDWFRKRDQCPAGCGCRCLRQSNM
ncbi:GATOR2 complex protein WDR59 isoform X2 [Stigmatopora nigra]